MGLGFLIVLFVGYRYYRTKSLRWVLMLFGIILIVGSWFGVQAAKSHHFGMDKVTASKQIDIAPKATIADLNFITISKGEDGDAQYHYTMKNKSYKTDTHGTTMRVVKGAKPILEQKMTSYQAESFFQKLLLVGLPDETTGESEFIFRLPTSYHVITEKQLTALNKLLEASKTDINKQVKAQVTQQINDKIKANKDYVNDKDGQKQLQADIIKNVTAAANTQLQTAVQKQLKAWNVE
jgi:hypothetical protein